MSKSTQAELDLRVNEVYEQIIAGRSRGNILQYSAENWDVSERQVDNYIKKARERMQEELKQNYPYKLGEIIKKLDRIYHKAMCGVTRLGAKGIEFNDIDLSVARQALMDQAKLLGFVKETFQFDSPEDEEAMKEFGTWDDEKLEQYAH